MKGYSKYIIKPHARSSLRASQGIFFEDSLPRGNLFDIPDTPGPGAYSAKPTSPRGLLRSTISRSVERFPVEEKVDPLDFYYPPEFFSYGNKGPRIGHLPMPKTLSMTPTPGPGDYNITPTKKPVGHQIATRKPEKPNTNPGPGQYNIADKPKIPGYQFSKLPTKVKEQEPAPGPAQYVKPNSYIHEPDNVMLANVRISLKNIKDRSAAISYIHSNIQLRNVMDEIMEMILRDKPDKPLEYIYDYFKQFKPEDPEDKIDLSILYNWYFNNILFMLRFLSQYFFCK